MDLQGLPAGDKGHRGPTTGRLSIGTGLHSIYDFGDEYLPPSRAAMAGARQYAKPATTLSRLWSSSLDPRGGSNVCRGEVTTHVVKFPAQWRCAVVSRKVRTTF